MGQSVHFVILLSPAIESQAYWTLWASGQKNLSWLWLVLYDTVSKVWYIRLGLVGVDDRDSFCLILVGHEHRRMIWWDYIYSATVLRAG
jgi:hypothetical protein